MEVRESRAPRNSGNLRDQAEKSPIYAKKKCRTPKRRLARTVKRAHRRKEARVAKRERRKRQVGLADLFGAYETAQDRKKICEDTASERSEDNGVGISRFLWGDKASRTKGKKMLKMAI